MAYSVGFRSISEGRDLRGRLALAHLAALSFTCLARQTLKVERGWKEDEN
jgi:hypothetical protein